MQESLVVWTPGMTLDQLEKKVILQAYRHYRANKTMTAQALGISVRTLDNKFAEYESVQETEKYTPPTRTEILERNQNGLDKTLPGGLSAHQAKPFESDGTELITKTLPGGGMSKFQLDELAERAATRNAARSKLEAELQGHSEVEGQGTGTTGDASELGLPVQSADQVSAQSSMSVSEREKVQSLPPNVAATGSGRGNSANLRQGNGRPNQVHNKGSR